MADKQSASDDINLDFTPSQSAAPLEPSGSIPSIPPQKPVSATPISPDPLPDETITTASQPPQPSTESGLETPSVATGQDQFQTPAFSSIDPTPSEPNLDSMPPPPITPDPLPVSAPSVNAPAQELVPNPPHLAQAIPGQEPAGSENNSNTNWEFANQAQNTQPQSTPEPGRGIFNTKLKLLLAAVVGLVIVAVVLLFVI